ncbi:protein NRT1/ PTR FAMILY 5.6-like [Syzygium oleosum]|uniref:protein NRT1/ PTR FAMILY 5.6-like n=1 Tax=Syzygium oleosum TaxID=219896 RepID=UPI0024BBC0CD|nr:protein NRT1/ PTR FAMILY 5.6-like [Syzygium oleosum]
MEEEKKRQEKEAREGDEEKWVHDSSVDHRGRLPRRASTGVWKAALFIITIEFSERLCYFGIATNLITYLTRVIHQDLKTAAKSVNYWAGVTTLVPLIGGFLADAYTGRFPIILASSLVYLVGLSLLTMSQLIPSLRPCDSSSPCNRTRKVHEVVLFVALYLISIGTGGHKPCLESFGADQFDDNHAEERKKKMSYFNWWNFALCGGLVLGVTIIVYVQDYVSWGVADLVLAFTMAVTIGTFYTGRSYYRYLAPEGSPLTPLLQVLVAAIRKRNLPHPSSPDSLFEASASESSHKRLLHHTNRLRFFDKAAILEGGEELSNGEKYDPWRLATATQVEEMKLVLNMIPIWLTSLPFGVCVAQAPTFFVKQGVAMDRRIGGGDRRIGGGGRSFEIPAATTYALGAVGMIISVTIYEKLLVPFLRKSTGNERGINILQRIGFGMIFSVAAMSVAAFVEAKRLRMWKHDILTQGRAMTKPSMSVFWLAPQFLILGLGDGFALVGLQEYFYDQVPDSMRSLGIALYLSVLGGGSFLSSFLITIVDHVTRRADGGGEGWVGKDLNSSRLDRFYWLLAAINLVTLCVYVAIARRYTYKNVQRRVVVVSDCRENGEEDHEARA